MKKAIITAVSLFLLACCGKNDFAEFSTLSGTWCPRTVNCLSDKYIVFESGNIDTWCSSIRHAAGDGAVWGVREGDFVRTFTGRYSIKGGCLVSGNSNFGPVSLKGDVLTIDGQEYFRVKSFEAGQYSTIKVSEEAFVPTSSVLAIPYSIDRPVPGFDKLDVRSNVPWIYACFADGSFVRCSVSVDRSPETEGTITLSNDFAPDVTIRILRPYND